MNKSITGQVQTDAISGSIIADSVVRNATKGPIILLNHCAFDKLGCGGTVADKTCESVFPIRDVITEYKSRWFESEEAEA